jgi:hypothetical protein
MLDKVIDKVTNGLLISGLDSIGCQYETCPLMTCQVYEILPDVVEFERKVNMSTLWPKS